MQIKVGLLFSFTGTTSITEKGQYDAACFAINQFNREQHDIEVLTRDICSDPYQAFIEAEKLAQDGVKIFIGCYTSACRKAILPVLEKYDCLLVYPTLYEGQENHPNVFYTGEVPNQQVHTLIDYLMTQYGKRIYLIGNDYIYPRETHAQVKAYVEEHGGEIIEETYVPFGHVDFYQTAQDIILNKPDAVFSTLVGQSVFSFYQTYYKMGLEPDTIPIFSPITKETELEAMGPEFGAGHYGSASYFQSLSHPKNQAFVDNFHAYFGEKRAISSVMFNTFIGTKLILDAVIETNDFHYRRLFQHLSGKRMETECGTLLIDTDKQHLSRPVKIGKALPNGQFDIVWDSASNIQARPYRRHHLQQTSVNELVLHAWGQISEEALIVLSKYKTIQYMSRIAEELTGFKNGDTITPKRLRQMQKEFTITSYDATAKTLLLLHQKQRQALEPLMQFGNIQTRNSDFQHELETATIAAQTTANVLIIGETGTGKEVLARAIHATSNRNAEPFIAVNMGAIPKDLIVSELFGYMEGTFTGAKRGGAIGKFESAHKGTLFLDEIGDMPLELQVTLLRAIETKQIVRLGDTQERAVDIRIIAATNKNLQEEIAYNNAFRSDLYYRLNVLSIDIPPLRERPEDIEALVWRFMDEFSHIYGKGPTQIADEVMQLFVEYPWSGNIRELRNVTERAYLLAQGKSQLILLDYLPRHIKGFFKRKAPSALTLKEAEKKMITQALKESNNVNQASTKLGIGRSTLYRKMKELNISL